MITGDQVWNWATARNPVEVEIYLLRYSGLRNLLRKAYSVLTRYFGGFVKIVFEVMPCPNTEELVGWIQSTDSVEEGLRNLNRFEDEWFLDRLSSIDGRFSFNIETL